MSRFLQILLSLIGVGVIGGGVLTFALVRGQSSDNNPSSNDSSATETSRNSNASSNANKKTNSSATKNSSTSRNASDDEGDSSVTASSCEDFTIEGRWSLTTDLQGITFTPPYAGKEAFFEFGGNGKVDFVEEYHDDGIDASAKHVGTWTKDGCGFVYSGVADGSGTSTDFGDFTLHFAITAPGTLNVSMKTLSGNWTSKETYKSSSGTTNQVVTGVWTAKKLTE